MKFRISLGVTTMSLGLMGALVVMPPSAVAIISQSDHVDVEGSGNPNDPGVNVEGLGEVSGGEEEVAWVGDPTDSGATYEFDWLPTCFDNYPGQQIVMCGVAQSCPSQGDLRWTYWLRQLTSDDGSSTPNATWEAQYSQCLGEEPEGAQPVVTDDDVLAAVRRLGLPRLTIQVQPAGETLVNFETIFYAEPQPWVRTVTLLGYTVEVEATVAGYSWVFGDGSTSSTVTPGAPYPATDVMHEYADAQVKVQPRVDVAYEIGYRVDGGEWQRIDETVPAQGYAAELLIREAVPVLVGN